MPPDVLLEFLRERVDWFRERWVLAYREVARRRAESARYRNCWTSEGADRAMTVELSGLREVHARGYRAVSYAAVHRARRQLLSGVAHEVSGQRGEDWPHVVVDVNSLARAVREEMDEVADGELRRMVAYLWMLQGDATDDGEIALVTLARWLGVSRSVALSMSRPMLVDVFLHDRARRVMSRAREIVRGGGGGDCPSRAGIKSR